MARHIETAKLFHIKCEDNERKFFYHVLGNTPIGMAVHKTDEWAPVPEDVFVFLRRECWRTDKREDRESRCRVKNKNGIIIRCHEDCNHCPFQNNGTGAGERSGTPLSLDKLLEDGQAPEAPLSPEEMVVRNELIEALYLAIASLCETDRYIVEQYYFEGLTEQKIAEELGMSQKTINNRKQRSLKRLKNELN